MPIPQASYHNATAQQRAAFVERLFTATAGVFDLFTIYIGDRLGLYQALADHGALTATALAARTGTHARYIREWLEQQAVAGILEVENTEAGAPRRRFRLPPGHAEVLVERDSLDYLAPLVQLVVGATRPLAAVLDAYRSGSGVPYSAYGADVCEGQAGVNRAAFLHLLGSVWLPAIPDVHARLLTDPPARVADMPVASLAPFVETRSPRACGRYRVRSGLVKYRHRQKLSQGAGGRL